MKNFLVLKKHNINTLKELVDTLYPNLVNDEVFNDKIDKRYYLDYFMNYLNISKSNIFEKIKSFTNIECFEDFDTLNKEDIVANIKKLEILKKYNFCPIIRAQKIRALITSNPFLLYSKFNIPENVSIFISTGKDLNDFLDSLINESSEVNEDNDEDVFSKTLKSLIIDVEERGVFNIIFEKMEAEVFYNIKDNDDNWKKGQIINQNLEVFWNILNSDFLAKLNIDKFFQIRKLNVTNLNNTVILKWNIPKKILETHNNIAIVCNDELKSKEIREYLKNHNLNVKIYKNFFDLYKDYKTYKFKIVIICLECKFLKEEEKIFKSNKSKTKNILIDFDGISEVEAYLMGVDYYIERDFTSDYLYDVIKNFYNK